MKCDNCGAKDNLFVLKTENGKIKFYCNKCLAKIIKRNPTHIYQTQLLIV